MTIKLSEFLAKEKQISLEYLGETLEVTFRVNAFNTTFIENYYGSKWNESHPGENRLDSQLTELISGWNLVDDAGKALAPSQDLIAQLPLKLKELIGKTMWESMANPGEEAKKG
jgi:hypothetical protein